MDRESLLCLQGDEPAVIEYLAPLGGELCESTDEDGVQWLKLVAPDEQPEVFFARLAWTRYPGQPPSIKFASGIDGPLDDPLTWPNAKGFRPTSLDICRPFCAEGLALHPDWQNSSEKWSAEGNPLLFVVQCLQDALTTSFSGRYQP